MFNLLNNFLCMFLVQNNKIIVFNKTAEAQIHLKSVYDIWIFVFAADKIKGSNRRLIPKEFT